MHLPQADADVDAGPSFHSSALYDLMLPTEISLCHPTRCLLEGYLSVL